MEYVERRYRSRMGRDAVVFTVSHRESDLWIAVDRGDAAVMAARDWRLHFDPERCIACKLCLKSCPLGLFHIEFTEA